MTRRRAVPRWLNLLLIGMSIAGLVITAAPPNNRVNAAPKQQSLGWLSIHVVDRNGQPLDAIVVVQGTYSQTGRTDGQGFYRMSIPAGAYVVSALYATYSTETRQVNVVSGRTRNVTLRFSLFAGSASTTTRPQGASSPSAVRAPQAGGPGSLKGGTGSPPPGGSGSGSGDIAGSGSLVGGNRNKPHKIKSLKADPGVTEPNGTSHITAVVDNPSGAPLTYSWLASGGTISGQGSEATWVAPPATGQFTISLTVTDAKKRKASASVTVQTVEASSSEPVPTPEPSPPTGSRDPGTWPFDSYSPWNYPIGSNAQYADETSVGWDVSLGGYANIEWYSVSTYVASSSDPVRKIYRRQKNVNGVTVDLGYPGELWLQTPVPDAAKPPSGTDGNMNIVTPDRAAVFELYQVERLSNGDLTILLGEQNYPKSNGLAWGSTYAAQISSMGGMIRKDELINGSGGLGTGIRHALSGILPPTGLNRTDLPKAPGYGDTWRSPVWPANSSDPPSGYATTGNVWMGSLLAIPPWVDINALGISDPQALEVARAMQDYGVYITDTGSTSGKLVIRIDPQAGVDVRDRTAFQAGISRAMQQLKVVTNSHDDGGKPAWGPGGGGTPRRPLAPAISQASGLSRGGLASRPQHAPGSAIAFIASAAILRARRKRGG